MSIQNFQKPELRREIRLGLVVYGGVALAVYMNGVCREFYNAVRGRGIYKLIKALTDSDIVVDIVSGTSAGGINGVLLSYALTNSSESEVVDFADFAQIWRESGDIVKLLRQPTPSDSLTESLLNGEGYYQNQLKEALEKALNNKTSAPNDEWNSQFSELDLFVTGTDVFGRVYKVFDDTGSVIEIKDHRAMFQLKHRQGRKEPFNANRDLSPLQLTLEETHQALAKMCRITSCFPVAFPVVDVALQKNDNDKVAQKLVEWGWLDKRELPDKPPEGGYQLYFVDGGVLDNRPFSYTIKEMYYRTANRPVDRKLFYIDPNPDRFTNKDDAKFRNMPKPNTLQVIQDSLVGIPTYESIGNDLQLIKEHNEKVRRYKSILKETEVTADLNPEILQQNPTQEVIYLRSRLISLRDRVLPLVLRIGQDITPDSDKQPVLEKIANLLTEQVTGAKEGKSREVIRQFLAKQIRNLDVEYALRKHFYLIQHLCVLLEKEPNQAEYKKLQTLSTNITRQIKLLEVIRQALELVLSDSQVSESFYKLLDQDKPNNQKSSQFYDHLLRLHRFVLDVSGLENFTPTDKSFLENISGDIFQTLPSEAKKSHYTGWMNQKQVSSILEQFKQKLTYLESPDKLEKNIWSNPKFEYDDIAEEATVTILRQVELASEALIEASQLEGSQKILHRFQRFIELDQVLYPFEYLTDIKEKELIQTIRISPNDAQMAFGKGKTVKDKLAGETLYAFGGFFKKSWRSNDILWGRLDGQNRLIEALVTTESLKKFPEFLKRQARENDCPDSGEEFEIFKEKYFEFLLHESLPNAQPSDSEALLRLRQHGAKQQSADRQKLISHLRKLATPENLTEEQLKSILDDLVLEGQREILNTDLQNVLADEIEEQFSWNQQRVEPTDSPKRKTIPSTGKSNKLPRYQPVSGYFEQSVSALAAAKLAKEALGDLSRENLEDFFRKKYNVGSETLLDSLPTIVLANISTRFGLILRNVVLTTLGTRSKLLRRSLTFNFLDKSLQLFYWWLQLRAALALQTPSFTLKRPLLVGVQIVLLLLAISGVAITVSKSLGWVAIAFIATVLFWLLGFLGKNTSR
jgi:patatin-related protein